MLPKPDIASFAALATQRFREEEEAKKLREKIAADAREAEKTRLDEAVDNLFTEAQWREFDASLFSQIACRRDYTKGTGQAYTIVASSLAYPSFVDIVDRAVFHEALSRRFPVTNCVGITEIWYHKSSDSFGFIIY